VSHNIVLLGTQWGDEGKGKIIDMLAGRALAVVRWQGGHNAGHSLMRGGHTTILRLVPSGALWKDVLCLLGNGVVVSPQALCEELEQLENRNIHVRERLWISPACPLVLPVHEAIDKAREETAEKKRRIGTTGRGIGPAYEDKAARRSLRIGDLAYLPEMELRTRVMEITDYHNFMLRHYYKCATVDPEKSGDELHAAAEVLRPRISDVAATLNDLRSRPGLVLFEGAQGTMLDVDMGTYPFVTSSNTIAGNAAIGSGISPLLIDSVVGIAKAYTTRVGEGPFPTELKDGYGKILATAGREYGSVTGRPRRCGWLDMVALRKAICINGIESLCITKLDVLDKFDKILVCTEYEEDKAMPGLDSSGHWNYTHIRPVYREFSGWQTSLKGIRSATALPDNARAYIEYIEAATEIPVATISTGPERGDNVILDRRSPLFAENGFSRARTPG